MTKDVFLKEAEVGIASAGAKFLPREDVEVLGSFLPLSANFCASEHLIVFFPGAHNLQLQKPKFQRSAYFEDLEFNCVSLFDPTLFMKEDLAIGWFQGGSGVPHFERARILIDHILAVRGLLSKNLVLFATSAGGLPAIKVSESFPESTVFVGNPQTDIMKYFKPAVEKLLDTICPGGSPSTLQRSNMSIVGTKSAAKIVYAQNVQDKFHMKAHMEPFMNSRPDINLILYDHPSGHNPMDQQTELSVIRAIAAGYDPRAAYNSLIPD